jgi:molybdopterin-guanine dinucleotide biosynthesis adapter protein
MAARRVSTLVVTGYAGSGKTTLIERLVVDLGQRGLRVGVVKHHRHPGVLQDGAKDSERYAAAGAAAVALMGPAHTSVVWPAAAAPSLDELAALMPADLVLAEGFKGTAGPRLIVYGERPESVAELSEGRSVVAVVGEGGPVAIACPQYRRDDVGAIADCVVRWLRERQAADRG